MKRSRRIQLICIIVAIIAAATLYYSEYRFAPISTTGNTEALERGLQKFQGAAESRPEVLGSRLLDNTMLVYYRDTAKDLIGLATYTKGLNGRYRLMRTSADWGSPLNSNFVTTDQESYRVSTAVRNRGDIAAIIYCNRELGLELRREIEGQELFLILPLQGNDYDPLWTKLVDRDGNDISDRY